MDIRSRILKGRMLEKMSRNPDYCRFLGLQDKTKFRSAAPPAFPPLRRDPAQDAEPQNAAEAETK